MLLKWNLSHLSIGIKVHAAGRDASKKRCSLSLRMGNPWVGFTGKSLARLSSPTGKPIPIAPTSAEPMLLQCAAYRSLGIDPKFSIERALFGGRRRDLA